MKDNQTNISETIVSFLFFRKKERNDIMSSAVIVKKNFMFDRLLFKLYACMFLIQEYQWGRGVNE